MKHFSAGQHIAFIITKGVWYALRCYFDLAPASAAPFQKFYSQHMSLNGAKVSQWPNFYTVLIIDLLFTSGTDREIEERSWHKVSQSSLL